MEQMISWFNEAYAPEHLEQDLARYAAEKSNVHLGNWMG